MDPLNTIGFIICKNEEANIERCIQALLAASLRVIVVDSGSTDGTLEIARKHGVEVRPHVYESHCQTYNELTTSLPPSESCVIVDADMVVSAGLVREAQRKLDTGADVVRAPIQMVWAGHVLRHASLCPPKAIAFRGGRSYFVPYGHGEQIASDVRVADAKTSLIHDDRKPFTAYLANQVRYGQAMRARLQAGAVSWRDRVRGVSPLLVFAQPVVSYLLRGGFLDGRGGVLYAIDRLIAEAILFREAVSGAGPTRGRADKSEAAQPNRSHRPGPG